MSADSNQKSTDLIGIVNLRPRIRPKDPELLKQYMEQYHKNYYHKCYHKKCHYRCYHYHTTFYNEKREK